eukprot:m.190176 g.190176  ORF g.190176 m.190176 type:complete len:1038 (+) comp18222_c0_seq8:376-3489(+)
MQTDEELQGQGLLPTLSTGSFDVLGEDEQTCTVCTSYLQPHCLLTVQLKTEVGGNFGIALARVKPPNLPEAEYILDVYKGSPAWHSQLLPGDYIVKIEGEDISSWTHERAAATISQIAKLSGSVTLLVASSALTHVQRCQPVLRVDGRSSFSHVLPCRIWMTPDFCKMVLRDPASGAQIVLMLSSVRALWRGRNSRSFQLAFNGASPKMRRLMQDRDLCFSLITGNLHRNLFDFVGATRNVRAAWDAALQVLNNKQVRDVINSQAGQQSRWLQELYLGSNQRGLATVNWAEVKQMLEWLSCPTKDVKRGKRHFVELVCQQAASLPNVHYGYKPQPVINLSSFCIFFRTLDTRPELVAIFEPYRTEANIDEGLPPRLTAAQLQHFFAKEQDEKYSLEDCEAIVQRFAVDNTCRTAKCLDMAGAIDLMLSDRYGGLVEPKHCEVYQDMTRPLTEYLIASSHNTYLAEDQLTGPSQVECYVRVLLQGCRCVEIDIWDGEDGEPIVFHGHTLTSKLSFREVVEAIDQFAFVVSQYPVIISLENHCSVPFQKRVAHHMKEVFGDKLYTHYTPNGVCPSPHDLQGKILIKAKRINFEETASVRRSMSTQRGTMVSEGVTGEVWDDEDPTEPALRRVEQGVSRKSLKSSMLSKRPSSNAMIAAMQNALAAADPVQRRDSMLFAVQEGNENPQEIIGGPAKAVAAEMAAPRGGSVRSVRNKRSLGSGGASQKSTDSSVSSATEASSHFASAADRAAGYVDVALSQRASTGFQTLLKPGTMRKRKRKPLAAELSNLVALAAAHLQSYSEQLNQVSSSIGENKAKALIAADEDAVIALAQTQLLRVYPAGSRFQSTNFHPQEFWNAGAQIVAMNYQTLCPHMYLYLGRFADNGGCGYVLKQPRLRNFEPEQNKDLYIAVKIVSAQHLPQPLDGPSSTDRLIDPFVHVCVDGLPVDQQKGRTKTVMDNGFNPIWEETFEFRIQHPEYANISFVVLDDDVVGAEWVAQASLPVHSLRNGYRHVELYTHADNHRTKPWLFVHVEQAKVAR